MREAVAALIENYLTTAERKASESAAHAMRDPANPTAGRDAFRRRSMTDGAKHLGDAIRNRMERFK